MASTFVLWDSLRKFDSRSIRKSGSLKPTVFSSDPANAAGLHNFANASLSPRLSAGIVGTTLVVRAKGKKSSYTLGPVRFFCAAR